MLEFAKVDGTFIYICPSLRQSFPFTIGPSINGEATHPRTKGAVGRIL